MAEIGPGVPQKPQDPDKWRWLKDKFKFLQRKNPNAGVQGTDGPTSPSSSGLEPGQGLNQKPDLKTGASGGGTMPGQDPFKDTV